MLTSPYMKLPSFKKFDPQDFLRDLSSPQKQIPILKYVNKRNSIILYERFVRSPNFLPWFNKERLYEQKRASEAKKYAIYNFNVADAIADLNTNQCKQIYLKIEK
jgi:hypothetical protein